jgi:hypothetical protein
MRRLDLGAEGGVPRDGTNVADLEGMSVFFFIPALTHGTQEVIS